MGKATWQFVDQPIAAPAVALNMNDRSGSGVIIAPDRGWSMPSPPLNRSFVTNAFGDGSMMTASSYDNRELTFTLGILGSTDALKITRLNRVIAELAKTNNTIMYKQNPSAEPIFFRTFRSDEFDVLKDGKRDEFWTMTCKVTAEPFAIGLRKDNALVTVTNNPASGANPARFDITGVIGDSPTPAFVRIANLGAAGSVTIAQKTRPSSDFATMFVQAESGTLGTDTTSVADANASAGNVARTTYATVASSALRTTVVIPAGTPNDGWRGKYRVIIRLKSSGTTSEYRFRYQMETGGDFSYGPLTYYKAVNAYSLLDLGIIEVPPFYAPPQIGYSGLVSVPVSVDLGIMSERNSGADTTDIDYVYLMPADERVFTVRQSTALGFLIVDGPNDAVYGMAAGTTPFGATRTVDNNAGLCARFGLLPELVPNYTNRWYVLRNDASAITDTKDYEVSYWPRWREVANP